MTLKFTEEDLDLSELILRTRFESLVQKELRMVESAIDELMSKNDLKTDQIHAVLRTGGSSEIPAYINLLRKRFGSARIKEINPFTTIVGGLALKGHELSKAG